MRASLPALLGSPQPHSGRAGTLAPTSGGKLRKTTEVLGMTEDGFSCSLPLPVLGEGQGEGASHIDRRRSISSSENISLGRISGPKKVAAVESKAGFFARA